MIDLIREVAIQIAKRVIRQCGKVNDGVKTYKIGRVNLTEIFPQSWNVRSVWPERAILVVVGI